ncbi:uncharacterized protein TNCV_3458451 [Trichonephila clavipes]|nr:uncharacterized protein TNCV_3458451 [Trichonephila clavipes]
MISNYVNDQHDTGDQFLREFAYAIRTAMNETTGKTHAELFLGRKLITPFQKVVMVSDGTKFAVGDIERLFDEARRNTKSKHEKWEKYYNRCRRDVQIKIRTGSSDSNSSRHESSSFESVQRRSNESQYGRKKVSGVKVLEEKGISFKIDQGEKHTGKADKHEPLIRSPHRSWSEPSRKIKRRRKENIGRNSNAQHKWVQPQKKKKNKVESRPTIEMKTQQKGSVRARNSREKHYIPYIKEQARSGNKNTRRRGSQQQNGQERKEGVNTSRSISLEVLVGDVNYKP